MDILTIVLGIIVVVLALALFFQVKASREQAVEGRKSPLARMAVPI